MIPAGSSYLLCYVSETDSLMLHSQIWASSMGAALRKAEEEKAKHDSAVRWFVIHAYEAGTVSST